MQDFREDLIQSYREYSNDDLLEKLRSGNLTELAQKVAIDELGTRGIEFVPVDDSAQQVSHDEFTGFQDFETVANFLNVTDALIFQGHLEAEGIPAYIPDSYLGYGNAFLLTGTSGIRVQVPLSLVPQATEIVRAIRDGEYALEQPSQIGEPSSTQDQALLDTEEALLSFAQDPFWIETWQGLINKTSRLAGFNPFAAVLGTTWLFFRKMYVFGIVVILGEILVFRIFGFIGLIVLIRIPIGLLANILYYKKAERAVRDAQAAHLTKGQTVQRLKGQGGISVGGALISIFLMYTVAYVAASYLSSRL